MPSCIKKIRSGHAKDELRVAMNKDSKKEGKVTLTKIKFKMFMTNDSFTPSLTRQDKLQDSESLPESSSSGSLVGAQDLR